MTNKMSGKQTVVQGFNLDQFVGGADQLSAPSANGADPAIETKLAKVTSGAGQGRKSSRVNVRSSKELLTERVQIKLSKSEMDTLQKRIGLVPMSAYLRKVLKDGGLIG